MHPKSFFVVLSGSGRAAVATLLVEGPRAADAIDEYFRSKYVSARTMKINRIHFGTWEHHGRAEHLVVCRTAGDQFEVHCHGGRLAIANLAAALTEAGLPRISLEAWLAPTPGSASSHSARLMLPRSPTMRTTAILLDQLRGAMDDAWRELKSLLSTGDRATAEQRVAKLVERAEIGRHLVSRWSIVVAGRPNVGKSSLINCLLGYERTIVFDQPGTTRDVVTVEAAFDGWPVAITDTAGFRVSEDRIEQEGIRLAREKMEQADLVIQLVDLSDPHAPREMLPTSENEAQRQLSVGAKSDIRVATFASSAPTIDLATSAATGEGVAELMELVAKSLVPDPPQAGEAVPLAPSDVSLLETLQQHLAAGKLEDGAAIIAETEG